MSALPLPLPAPCARDCGFIILVFRPPLYVYSGTPLGRWTHSMLLFSSAGGHFCWRSAPAAACVYTKDTASVHPHTLRSVYADNSGRHVAITTDRSRAPASKVQAANGRRVRLTWRCPLVVDCRASGIMASRSSARVVQAPPRPRSKDSPVRERPAMSNTTNIIPSDMGPMPMRGASGHAAAAPAPGACVRTRARRRRRMFAVHHCDFPLNPYAQRIATEATRCPQCPPRRRAPALLPPPLTRWAPHPHRRCRT